MSTVYVPCVVITGVGHMYMYSMSWCTVIFLLNFLRLYIISHGGWVQQLQRTYSTAAHLHVFTSLWHSLAPGNIYWNTMRKSLPVFNAFFSNYLLKRDKCTDFISHKSIILYYFTFQLTLFCYLCPYHHSKFYYLLCNAGISKDNSAQLYVPL